MPRIREVRPQCADPNCQSGLGGGSRYSGVQTRTACGFGSSADRFPYSGDFLVRTWTRDFECGERKLGTDYEYPRIEPRLARVPQNNSFRCIRPTGGRKQQKETLGVRMARGRGPRLQLHSTNHLRTAQPSLPPAVKRTGGAVELFARTCQIFCVIGRQRLTMRGFAPYQAN